MKQVYAPYWEWEDYLSGMYSIGRARQEYVTKAIEVLSNKELFTASMRLLPNQWPVSTAVNITNKSINRRAWLGAAASMIQFKSTETETRLAWSMITEYERAIANNEAERFIRQYLYQNRGIRAEVEANGLFK